MQAGILVGKPEGNDIAVRAQRAFDAHGVHCVIAEESPRDICDAFFDGLDVLLSIGGDGTILAGAKRAGILGIPVLGVNLGRLGFLTEVEPDAVEDAVSRIVVGAYRVEQRLMLEAEAGGQRFHALNEILLEGAQRGRLMWYEQIIDDGVPDRIACDGLMVSSPTGSTAYSLSCGGPILAPELDAMIVSTVCAHTLRARPLVIGPLAVVSIRSGDGAHSTIYADGQPVASVDPGNSITVQRAPFHLKMIRFSRGDFYNLVRTKLSEWSYL